MTEVVDTKETTETTETVKPEQQLAVREIGTVGRYQPSNLPELFRWAERISETKLVPRHFQGDPSAIVLVVQQGEELGMSAMASMRSIHVIEGKPVLSADLQYALVVSHPMVATFEIVESTSERCLVVYCRRGWRSEREMVFAMEDAKKAQLLNKDNWKKYPQRMLRARAISWAARDVAPEIMHGIYDPDELTRVEADEDRNRGYVRDGDTIDVTSPDREQKPAPRRSERPQRSAPEPAKREATWADRIKHAHRLMTESAKKGEHGEWLYPYWEAAMAVEPTKEIREALGAVIRLIIVTAQTGLEPDALHEAWSKIDHEGLPELCRDPGSVMMDHLHWCAWYDARVDLDSGEGWLNQHDFDELEALVAELLELRPDDRPKWFGERIRAMKTVTTDEPKAAPAGAFDDSEIPF